MSVSIPGGRTLETASMAITAKGPSVVPTVSGPLATVTGNVLITGIWCVVTTVFTATVTSLNIGTIAGSSSLLSAAALASASVGTWFNGIPTSAAPVPAASGTIPWIAGATNTGQLKVYISYVPLDAGSGIS
jgi:hypothetical protein